MSGRILLATVTHDARSEGRKMSKFDLLQRSWQRPLLMASNFEFQTTSNYLEAVYLLAGPTVPSSIKKQVVCSGHRKSDWLYLKRSADQFSFGIGHLRAGVLAAFGPLRDRKSSREKLGRILSQIKKQAPDLQDGHHSLSPQEVRFVLGELGVSEIKLKGRNLISRWSLRYLYFVFRQVLRMVFYFLHSPKFDLAPDEAGDLSMLPPNILGDIFLVASKNEENWSYLVMKGAHLSHKLVLKTGPQDPETQRQLKPWLSKETSKIRRRLKPLKKEEVALVDSLLWCKTSKVGLKDTQFIKIDRPNYWI